MIKSIISRIHCFNGRVEGTCDDLEFSFWLECSGQQTRKKSRIAECTVDDQVHDYSSIDEIDGYTFTEEVFDGKYSWYTWQRKFF